MTEYSEPSGANRRSPTKEEHDRAVAERAAKFGGSKRKLHPLLFLAVVLAVLIPIVHFLLNMVPKMKNLFVFALVATTLVGCASASQNVQNIALAPLSINAEMRADQKELRLAAMVAIPKVREAERQFNREYDAYGYRYGDRQSTASAVYYGNYVPVVQDNGHQLREAQSQAAVRRQP